MTTYNPNMSTTVNIPDPTSTISTTSNITAGSYLTSTVTGTTWTNPSSHFNNGNGAVMTIPHGEDKVVIEEKAELEVKGRIKINGIDLEERLRTIEKVLLIPERDVTIEKNHPRLKKLYDEYMHELEKYRTWDNLKES